MNRLLSFVERINGFHERPAVFKIEVFSWYLHKVKGQDFVAASDLLPCFDVVHLQRPSNIYSQLNALCEKRPARLLKEKRGYRLSAISRGEMQTLLPLRDSTADTTSMLSALAPLLHNTAQRSFLTETMTCYGNGAYRAAVVMAWNLAYSHICDQIFQNTLDDFNAQLAKVLPKSNAINKRSDFDDFKESKVIEIGRGAGILSATTTKILREKLDKRNIAAHPTMTNVGAITAEEVIHDLVRNILLNEEL